MIGRRAMLVAGASLGARRAIAGMPTPTDASLGFRIMRHGSKIGTHRITFERSNDLLNVRTAVDVLVTLLSISLARYKNRSTETWQGTTLVGMAGETDDNGQRKWMNARRTGEGLLVLGSGTKGYIAPEAATPVSYWNKRMLKGPMISMEDGALLSPKVADLRPDSIQLASGQVIPASHYKLSSPIDLDIWYDEAETWAALMMTVVDGSEVSYERI